MTPRNTPYDHVAQAESLLLRAHDALDQEWLRDRMITPRTRDDAILFTQMALAHAQVAGAIVSAHIYDIAVADSGGST